VVREDARLPGLSGCFVLEDVRLHIIEKEERKALYKHFTIFIENFDGPHFDKMLIYSYINNQPEIGVIGIYYNI